ncbi:hypothetical protein F5Y17DRAFT_218235 [Xylariaceae sp. FL0594]|nr:hypothetical protein F5Y17DRAFT_218235 [Xylariaceae sp. FL0594]
MEHSIESVEPAVDFHDNLPELLAVDLEESSSVFQSRQLTAGTPAPGLSDDGSKRRYSFQQNPCFIGPLFRSQPPLGIVTESNSLRTIHKKYSDIFAPLDYSYHKRGSISSSECSADMEPPSLSTRGESVLTVDTWPEPEKNAPHISIQESVATEYGPQMSWMDLDDMSPTTERRRSSMTDFIRYTEQRRGKTLGTMSLDSRVLVNEDGPVTQASRESAACPAEIPRRRSSLMYQEVYLARQQLAMYFEEGTPLPDTQASVQYYSHNNDDSRQTCIDDAGISYHESEGGLTLRGTSSAKSHAHLALHSEHGKMTRKPVTNDGGDDDLGIASAEVGFGEWLESGMASIADDDPQPPRPLPPNILEICQFFVASFPEPMLTCNSLLVEKIRELSRGIRYDVKDRRLPPAVPVPPAGSHQTKLTKWKWLGNGPSPKEPPQDQMHTVPGTPPVSNKSEWSVMRKIFPHGRDDLCEALYAHVLVFNYVTLLCRRLPLRPSDSARPASPGSIDRPDTSGSSLSDELDLYDPAPLRPSLCETGGIPRKAASILGFGDEGVAPPPSFVSSTRQPSRGSSSRMSSYTSFRTNTPFFGGTGQWQKRHETKGSPPQLATAMVRRDSLNRPTTSAGYRPEQIKQLIELRHGLAMCCARLTITLHRANTKHMKYKEDRDCKVDPSFMQSLCENVRITEESINRTQ